MCLLMAASLPAFAFGVYILALKPLMTDAVHDRYIADLLLSVGSFAAITALVCFAEHYLWQLCFGKIIITDKYIRWRCLFCKSITLPVEEVKYTRVCTFSEGNMLYSKNSYNAGFLYVLLSSSPLPGKRIDKIRCKGKLIRFMLTDKLCEALVQTLPNGAVFTPYLPKKKKK